MDFLDEIAIDNIEIAGRLGRLAYLNEAFEIHVISLSEYEAQALFDINAEGIDLKVEAAIGEDPALEDLRHGDSITIPETIGGIYVETLYRVRGLQADGNGMILILLRKE